MHQKMEIYNKLRMHYERNFVLVLYFTKLKEKILYRASNIAIITRGTWAQYKSACDFLISDGGGRNTIADTSTKQFMALNDSMS